jgi:hypothetical protein
VFTVSYGTDATNLDHTLEALDSHSATLPTLQPHTQYFWQVGVRDDFAIYSGTMVNFSTVRSFTTSGQVATQASTWGRVKMLYRD